jgi:hypothetical protein
VGVIARGLARIQALLVGAVALSVRATGVLRFSALRLASPITATSGAIGKLERSHGAGKFSLTLWQGILQPCVEGDDSQPEDNWPLLQRHRRAFDTLIPVRADARLMLST